MYSLKVNGGLIQDSSIVYINNNIMIKNFISTKTEVQVLDDSFNFQIPLHTRSRGPTIYVTLC